MSYAAPAPGLPDPYLLTTISRGMLGDVSIGLASSTTASAVWPSANLAMFFPFRLLRRRTYQRAFWVNGTVVAGNVDVGVYNLAGTRIASLGNTAQAGTSVTQVANINWTLDPGDYLLGFGSSDGTATFSRVQPNGTVMRSHGCKQMASAMPLPASATFAAFANSYLPLVGLFEKTWV